MPVCRECGFTSKRLQWTHFKYNCTGRFNNSKEYKKVYPDAVLVDSELSKRTAVTLENLVAKYGEVEGQERWDAYRNKQSYSNTLEYKAEKYNWDKQKFDEFNASRASTFTNFVKKYGEVEGQQKWDDYCEKQRYTNSLSYFIEKYGDEGTNKWNEINRQKGNALNIDFIMMKYEVDREGAEEILSRRSNNSHISNNEMRFVDILIDRVGDIKYTYKTKQYCIWSDELSSPLFYDVTCSERRKIIEYNGDYWHCNPKITESTAVIKQNGMSAQEIWDRDRAKHNTAKNRGFDVYVVWESEFMSDPTTVIDNIEEWWNN